MRAVAFRHAQVDAAGRGPLAAHAGPRRGGRAVASAGRPVHPRHGPRRRVPPRSAPSCPTGWSPSTTSARTPPTAPRPTGPSPRTSPCCGASGRRGWPTGSRCRSSSPRSGSGCRRRRAGHPRRRAAGVRRGRRGRHHGDRRHGGPHHHRRHAGHRARLRADFPWVGAVVQSQLRRTEGDCRDLAGPGSRVRLCKGAYDEPESAAYAKKADVDASFARCLEILMAGEGLPMVATHDPRSSTWPGGSGRAGPAGTSCRCSTASGPTPRRRSPPTASGCASTCPTAPSGSATSCAGWPNGRPTWRSSCARSPPRN